MDEKTVLLISRGNAFMVNAIAKNITETGYGTAKIAPDVAELSDWRRKADIILFYLGSFIEDIPDFWVYLKDVCAEEEIPLILAGNPAEIVAVGKKFPPSLITTSFERPFDMKKLTAEIDRLMQKAGEFAKRKNILLVDDDGTYLKTVKGWLSPRYRVTIVTSGAQALMYIADNTPDLILLDYEMPVTSGPQVLEMIRSESKVGSIPVIFLTGKGDRESVMKVLALKPDGYLLKSTERDKLVAAVDDFFEKQKFLAVRES